MTFAECLKKVRKSKRFERKKLSEVSGIPRSTIRNWEQGIGEPRWSDVLKLALALDVSTEEFRPPAGRATRKGS